MTVREIRNLLYDYPHRLNDSHVECLLSLLENCQEAYSELEAENNRLRTESRQHSQAMLGNMLGLMLNKPELFAKE
jgi:hypothetical protein